MLALNPLPERAPAAEPGAEPAAGGWRRLARYLAAQRAELHVRLMLAQLAGRLLPYNTFSTPRALLYGLAGFRLAPGVRVAGPLTIWGAGDVYARLTVGARTFINSPAHIELNAPVHIGADCAIGHHAVIITSNHRLGPATRRAGALYAEPVHVGDGVWIGARVTILPGVTIGDGAFIAAGAVVTRDVPRNARVRGPGAEVVSVMEDAAPAARPVRRVP